jgi:arylsulfatase A-like enzyme
MTRKKFISIVLLSLSIIGVAYLSLSRQDEGLSSLKYPGVNVILILIDTLRADHLGCYGYHRNTSPVIDRLANEGLIFKNMLAQTSWTRPGTASILTGLYPKHHGANTRDDRLPEEVELLPEILSKHGYHTYAFVTNGNAGAAVGFNQGYKDFFTFNEKFKVDYTNIHMRAGKVNRHLLTFIRQLENTSSNFIYIHYTDPHAPYIPKKKHFSKNDEIAFTMDYIRSIPSRLARKDQAEVIKQMINAYDDEILRTDQMIGDVINTLKENNMYSHSIIIVTSDHGEEFFEHGNFSHGKTLYDEQLKVPLIIRLPGGIHAEINEIANQIDIAPTILSLLDIPVPPYIDGANLLNNTGRPDSYSYAELDLDGNALFSIQTTENKFIEGLYAAPRKKRGRWFKQRAIIETCDDTLELIVRALHKKRTLRVLLNGETIDQFTITSKKKTFNIPLPGDDEEKRVTIESPEPCQAPRQLGISKDPRCKGFRIFDSRNVDIENIIGEPRREYYTLSDDPMENNNRYDRKKYKKFIVLLRKELKKFKASLRFKRSGKSKKPIRFDEEQVKALKALGYLN